MGDLHAIGKKIRAKGQKVKGELQQQSGEGLKGGITKAKGNLNDTLADFELDTNRSSRDRDDTL
jgi:hypothetical protein